ncbi:ATP-dependent Clp protease ATP-binding subunit ClpX-like [Drosophila mauritiana]|uniref:ATP-dependent Clp protease ATP-binding subunit ClpX-like n=1 Tax=Drosophila mauritiana TaxID=7226 RepID=A0A6P8JUT8_DROMA|nr:ATP-dependent Clp protease ATP-binding subunit ClpX-like [Drosophila mauritiana]
MVVCKQFQSGSCVFGSKCIMEHIDLKQVVAEGVKHYLEGGAWCLSAFGPFSGRGNFPNHIEDQSFEECRLQHYMAKRQDRLTNYELQYVCEVSLATMKTANLLKMSPQILDTLIEIYEQPNSILVGSIFSKSDSTRLIAKANRIKPKASQQEKCQVQPQSLPGFQTNSNATSGNAIMGSFGETPSALKAPEQKPAFPVCNIKQQFQPLPTVFTFGATPCPLSCTAGFGADNSSASFGNIALGQIKTNQGTVFEKNNIFGLTKDEKKEKFAKLPPEPQKIMEFLDKHVVGQEFAKKVLSVAVYNHYKRIHHNLSQREQTADNAAETLSLCQLKISGDISTLNSASQKKDLFVFGSEQESSTFNWKFPGIQSNDVELEKSNIMMLGPTGSGKTLVAKSIAKCLDVPFAICDCTTLMQAGYVGGDIESVLLKLLKDANNDVERAQTGIVYLDKVDQICALSGSKGIQQGMLKILEGSVVSLTNRGQLFGKAVQMDTTNILFVASSAFTGLDKIIERRINEKNSDVTSTGEAGPSNAHQQERDKCLIKVQACDLAEFGMIPEFVGHFPIIVPFHSLDEYMLVRILTEPPNALVSQYKAMLRLDGVELTFSHDALISVAQLAMTGNMGARGLRPIMEQLLLDPMFLVPGSDIQGVHITADNVMGKAKPKYRRATDKTPSKFNVMDHPAAVSSTTDNPVA